MKKFIQNKLKEQKGLTLIELLAVIVILAIIAAIAIPAIGNIIENSRVSAIKADAQNTLAAANLYFTENGTADGAIIKITALSEFLDDQGSMENSVVVKKASDGNKIYGTGKTSGGTSVIFNGKTNSDISDKDWDGDTSVDIPEATIPVTTPGE